MFTVNGLVLGAIVRYSKMRQKKEYLMIAALALADGLTGWIA